MPELPEVRTVKEQLKMHILNKTITGVEIHYKNITSDNLLSIINHQVADVNTYGKFIVINLSRELNLIVHLRMEGKFFIKEISAPKTKHEHVIFTLDNGSTLRYDDTRKFGKMYVRTTEELFTKEPLLSLAKEPFDISKNAFYDSIKNRKAPIKSVLLDQRTISGIGNIYADEILFLSKIHPTRMSSMVTKDESAIIIDMSIRTLNKAISLGGSTIHSYNSFGIDGMFQNELLVHTKMGKPCPVCGAPITKIKVGGRGTYVCEFCQK